MFVGSTGTQTAYINSALVLNPGASTVGVGTTNLSNGSFIVQNTYSSAGIDSSAIVIRDTALNGTAENRRMVIGPVSSSDVFIRYMNSGSLLFSNTLGTEVARITATGNVGVGTSTINTGNMMAVYGGNVFVAGNVRVGNTATRIGGIQFSDGTFQTTAAVPLGTATTMSITSQTASTAYYPVFVAGTGSQSEYINTASFQVIPNSGNITTIGSAWHGNLSLTNTTVSTSTTNGALIVAGGAGMAGNLFVGGSINGANINLTGASAPPNGIWLPGTNVLGFATNSSERMRIDTNGNVTIGTTSGAAYGPFAIYRSTNTGGYPYITMDVGATGYRYTSYNTAGYSRWQIGVDNTAETGSNAGSNFFMSSVTDAGTYLASPFRITRSTGMVYMSNGVVITGGITSSGDITVYRTAATTTGAIYLGNSGTRCLYYDGSSYSLTGAGLSVQGNLFAYNPSSLGTGAIFLGNTGSKYLYYDGSNFTLAGGGLYVTGDVIAYSSDQRLKSNVSSITDAISKVKALNGVMFDWNDNAADLGFNPSFKRDVGVLAQEVERVLPEAVRLAPFDRNEDGSSKSGENYLTVQYEKLTALLIEAVKELNDKVEALGDEIKRLTGE